MHGAIRGHIRIWPLLLAGVLFGAATASGNGPSEWIDAIDTAGNPIVEKAIDPDFPDVVVFASNSVRLKQGATVLSGDVVANVASPGPTLQDGFEISMDPGSSTPAGFSVRGDSVRIKNAATAGGDVAYNDLLRKGTVGGTEISPLALPVFASLPPFFTAAPAPGAAGVTVAAGGFAALPPGEYGDLLLGEGATLSLDGGTYDVLSVTAGKNASLLFAAAAEVRVQGRLLTGKGVVVGPEGGSGVAPHDLVFYVAGIDGLDGALGSTPRAAEIGHSNALLANVYAPNGTLRIGQFGEATGAFLARDVLVENGAALALDSFFFNRPPIATNDAATVDEGGTVTVLDSAAVSLLANDSDPNGDALMVTTTPVAAPAHGTVTLAADGTFSYTHDGGETTADAFVYQVCDDGAPPLCDTATVSITVVPVNDPPIAVDDSATVGQGGAVSLLDSGQASVLANDSDPEGGALTVALTPLVDPVAGVVTLAADGTFTYTHLGLTDATSDAFVYQVCDAHVPAACSTATVSIAIVERPILTVSRFGLGSGDVTSSPPGIDCGDACAAPFDPGTVVTLLAQPSGTSVFGGFSGDPDCADGTVTLTADTTCLARFDLPIAPAVLTVTLAGGGSGSVGSSPGGIACPGDCSEPYPIPSRVELFATAASGSVFAGWSGDSDCEDGVLDLFGSTACVAVFETLPPPVPTFTLTLSFLGSGGATVTSSPAGVLCESDCAVEFPQGTAVTLFVRPFEGSFTGWGGDCSGAAISTSVTLDADKACTVSIVP